MICGGDLFSYLARGEHLKALSEPDCAIIMYQILQAVGYLHSNGIVHRDLKVRVIIKISFYLLELPHLEILTIMTFVSWIISFSLHQNP